MAINASDPHEAMLERYRKRKSFLYRALKPPAPYITNPKERFLPHCEGTKLFMGGAGGAVPPGFLNIDIVDVEGVDCVADIEHLPFAAGSIAAIECDAVLEHVKDPVQAVSEMNRVLVPGGYLHVVVPFCHPYHGYPSDYHRWSVEGLRGLLASFEIVDAGVRTGPAATLLVFGLELVKLCSPRFMRRFSYGVFGWIVWPLRYLDAWMNRFPESQLLANHTYILARKK